MIAENSDLFILNFPMNVTKEDKNVYGNVACVKQSFFLLLFIFFKLKGVTNILIEHFFFFFYYFMDAKLLLL